MTKNPYGWDAAGKAFTILVTSNDNCYRNPVFTYRIDGAFTKTSDYPQLSTCLAPRRFI
jgi:hypothetical protein